jgi:hypothetical protein
MKSRVFKTFSLYACILLLWGMCRCTACAYYAHLVGGDLHADVYGNSSSSLGLNIRLIILERRVRGIWVKLNIEIEIDFPNLLPVEVEHEQLFRWVGACARHMHMFHGCIFMLVRSITVADVSAVCQALIFMLRLTWQ